MNALSLKIKVVSSLTVDDVRVTSLYKKVLISFCNSDEISFEARRLNRGVCNHIAWH